MRLIITDGGKRRKAKEITHFLPFVRIATQYVAMMDSAKVLAAKETVSKIRENIERVMKGQSAGIRKMLAALVSGGHVLLEDFPGTGKTTFAKALALSIGAEFKRIQFTPDLLPTDILGVSVFNQKDQTFEFRRGPIFANIVLADEINRASARTQSALLEAMGEFQVSVDGVRYPLEHLFFVIATQNPVEFRGTYPLPEAQMDRFAMQFGLGYVSPEDEVEILSAQQHRHPIDDIGPCASLQDVLAVKDQVKEIRISTELQRYLVEIVRMTRSATGVQLGASPRASLALSRAAQALALFDGMEFVTPEHIQELVVPVISHRLMLDPQARFSGATAQTIVEDVVKQIAVPA